MDTRDLCFHSISHLAELLAQGDVSPVELTQAYVARIDQIDPQLRSFITVPSGTHYDRQCRSYPHTYHGKEPTHES